MKRISTSTAFQNKFVDGNKATGRKATQFSAEWCNQVQEEICKILEAAGITIGDSDHQLKDLFTVLFVLDLTLKSMICKKSFTGGESTVTSNGEKISMSAEGSSVVDNSSSELSRMLLKFSKSSYGGLLQTEMSPNHIIVKSVDSGDANVIVEVLNNCISFKSGSSNSVSEHASIEYDPTTGTITISGIGGVTFADKIFASMGVNGDIETDSISPATTGNSTPVKIGSATGGVKLVGRTTGFVGEVKTNLIEVDDADYPIVVKAVVKATNLPNDFVTIDVNTDTSDPAVSSTFLLKNDWTIGQVKRFLNVGSSAKDFWIYTDNQGAAFQLSIPAHAYVTFACIGYYNNTFDNKQYAVLAYNN